MGYRVNNLIYAAGPDMIGMRKVILDGIGTNTFEVSYTSRVPWSGLDKYITNVVPYRNMN